MAYDFTNKPWPNIFSDFYSELEGYLDGITVGGVAGGALVDSIKVAKITLNGGTYTPVVFGSATAATVTSTEAETYDLTGVGDGGTIIINPDGAGVDTATVNFAGGNSISGASPSTDISGGVDKKFNISVDGDAAEEVELTLAGLNSGAGIAAAMQDAIRALGGNKALVTVDYNSTTAGKYHIASPTLGTNSAVVITEADSFSVTEELKIGTVAGGVETAGTGDVADATAATAAEIAAVINTDIAGVTADGTSGSLVITSDTTGAGSTLVFGDSTLKTVLGLANALTAYGSEGLGLTDMADTDYVVSAVLTGAADQSARGLSINNIATTGFRVYCETTAATDDVFLTICGLSA